MDVFLVKGEIYMTILLTNFFLCLLYAILAWFFRVRTKTRNFDKFFMAITFLQLVVVHSFIDPFSVPDLPSYHDMFFELKKIKGFSFFSLKGIEQIDIEPGYLLFAKLVSLLSNSFVVFLLCVSIIIVGSYFFVFKKYSPYPFISIIMLLLTSFNQSIFVLRQHIAIGLCLLTIPLIIKREQIKFLFIVFVAFLFHRSAFIWIPVYYLYGLKKDRNLLMIGFFGGIASYLFASVIYELVLNSFTAYNAYTGEGSIVNLLIPSLVLVFYVIFLRKKIFDKGINRLVFVCLMLYFVLSIGFYDIEGVGRLSEFYFCMFTIAIPITINYIKQGVVKNMYAICSLVLFFILTFFTGKIEYFEDFRLLFI